MRAAAWAVVLPAVERRSFSRGHHTIGGLLRQGAINP